MQFSYGSRYIFHVISPESSSSPSTPRATLRTLPGKPAKRARLRLPRWCWALQPVWPRWWLQPRPAAADEALDAARKRTRSASATYVEGRYWQSRQGLRGGLQPLEARRSAVQCRPGPIAASTRCGPSSRIRAISTRCPTRRIAARLRSASVSYRPPWLLMIVIDEKAYILIDGHEIGRTPLGAPIDMDSGYHRLTVRKGQPVLQQRAAVQRRRDLSLRSDADPIARAIPGPRQRQPKKRTRGCRHAAAALCGGAWCVGGAIDVAGGFPPHQVAMTLGLDYRARLRSSYAIDIMMRVPFELAVNGWRNAGFTLGARAAIFRPSPASKSTSSWRRSGCWSPRSRSFPTARAFARPLVR